MLIAASALAAIIPMSVYLYLIWRFDSYDREPFRLVFQNYLLGALGAIFFAIIGSALVSEAISFLVPDRETLTLIETIFIAPVVEEVTKAAFIFLIFSHRKFDNLTDGIVYGGAIGLGFGMTENFLYFISYGTTISGWIMLVIIRTMFSAVMHCIATASFGAFLGYAKFKQAPLNILLPAAGLGVAIFIHFLWNFSVSFESTTAGGFIFMLVTIAFFIVVFSSSIASEKKIIYTELLEEANNGIIPREHLVILNSAARNRNGWINEKIRRVYITAATTLAFRKIQYKNSKGSSRFYYEQDINNYRNFIVNILRDSNPEYYEV